MPLETATEAARLSIVTMEDRTNPPIWLGLYCIDMCTLCIPPAKVRIPVWN